MRKSNGFSARQLSDDDLHPLLCGVALDIGRYEKCEKCFIQGICGRGCPGIEVTDYKHSVFSDECEQRREYARALLKAALTHN